MSPAAGETADSATQSLTATNDLAHMATTLQLLISHFRTETVHAH